MRPSPDCWRQAADSENSGKQRKLELYKSPNSPTVRFRTVGQNNLENGCNGDSPSNRFMLVRPAWV